MTEQEINEIAFGLYDDGFRDGQYAMISSITNLGLINEPMADMLRGVLAGHQIFKDYFTHNGASAKAKHATEKIMGMFEL